MACVYCKVQSKTCTYRRKECNRKEKLTQTFVIYLKGNLKRPNCIKYIRTVLPNDKKSVNIKKEKKELTPK